MKTFYKLGQGKVLKFINGIYKNLQQIYVLKIRNKTRVFAIAAFVQCYTEVLASETKNRRKRDSKAKTKGVICT